MNLNPFTSFSDKSPCSWRHQCTEIHIINTSIALVDVPCAKYIKQ